MAATEDIQLCHLGVLFVRGNGLRRNGLPATVVVVMNSLAMGRYWPHVKQRGQGRIVMGGRGRNRGRRPVAVAIACLCAMVLVLVLLPGEARAQDIGYFGKNRLEFAAVSDGSESAAGTGIVDYKGGKEPDSRWRATFRFDGLTPGEDYTVVIRGRTGDQDSDAATAFTPLCSFKAEQDGAGTCFWYFQGLARLNIVQLREGEADGQRILQASRSGETGSIVTDPNRFSPGGENPSRKQSQGRS